MTNSAVEATDLHVERGSATLLRGLTFEVPVGSVTGLLGPPHSGKSTLLRAIAGTQRISGGRLRVLGQRAGSSALRGQVAFATSAAAPHAELTVTENVRYFAAVLRAPVGDVHRVIDAVGLTRKRDRIASQLSAGERSRMNLAAALLGQPKLLLLDEPTVALDMVMCEQLWQLFRSLADRGVAVIVSGGALKEAVSCDAFMLLRDGQLMTRTAPPAVSAPMTA